MKYSETYRNALAIQRLVVADAKDKDCEPKIRCLLARAFGELELLKLRLRMKPAPKPIDVSVKPAKRVKSVAFTEASSEQPARESAARHPIAPKPEPPTKPDSPSGS